MQGPNLVGDDDTATPTEDFDGSAVVLVQQGDHVPKELVVTALIRADCDGVCVLFDARLDDVGYRAIVAQVDDLRTKLLQETPHDVDGSVVSVKERGCGDHAGTGL